MEGSYGRSCSLLLICLMTVARGNEDLQHVINQVSQLQVDLLGKIVPSYIHSQVEQALARILGDQSIYDKVRHLRHNQQRHVHNMESRLKTLEDDRDEKMKTIVGLQEEHKKCELRMTDLQRELNTSQLHVSNVYSELKQEANSTQFKLHDIEDNYSKILNNLSSLTKVVDNSIERRLKTLEDDRDEKMRTLMRLQEEHEQCEVRMEDLQREVNSSQLHVSTVYSELKQETNSTRFKLYGIEDNYSKILNNVTLLTKVVDKSTERRLKTLEDDRDEKMRTLMRLQEEHEQCEVRMTDLHSELTTSQLHVSNVYSELKQEANSTQFKLDDIEDNYSKIMNNVTLLRKVFDNKMDNISRYCSCVEKTISSTDASLTYPPTPVTTVTPRVVEEMNRLLVIQRRSSTVQYPHQIDLHSNEMNTYTNLRTSHIAGLAYDPISRRIIFSRYDPKGIYSSRLDAGGVQTLRLNVMSTYTYLHTSHILSSTYDPISRRIIFSREDPAGIYSSRLNDESVKTLRHNVKSAGMVVDADRGIIFLTTHHPRYTISRMTTTGKHFHGIVDITDYSSHYARGIAIDGRQKVIYFCVWDRLSSVDYDGKNLRTRHTSGNGISTVVFDESKSSLFFNVNKKVMMKSLATNRNTEIMELDYGIWKFVLYNNSLYFSSWKAGNIDVIHLEDNVHFNLMNMEHKNNDIILVP